MPQMEFGDYLPQLVWLVITFAVLYVLMARIALPRIAEVLEGREERVADDIDRAGQHQAEASQVLAAYERTLAEARDQAHASATANRQKHAARAAEQRGVLEGRLKAQAADAEARIAASRAEAMAGLKDVAVDVARSATQRLIGVAPDDGALGAAVEDEIGRAGNV
jgi:F-type H+-transporting ATPase subunit b